MKRTNSSNSLEALHEAKEHLTRASARYRLRHSGITAQLRAFGASNNIEPEPITDVDHPIPESEES